MAASSSHADNELRILITTDTHVGFNENDSIRGQDSLDTFEEILKLAKEHTADFILHTGDLFHENKPSRNTMFEVIRLLRKHCWGDAPINFQFLSDPLTSLEHKKFGGGLNYEDPNINVAMPMFVIHGNHDDPIGVNNLCPLDVLAAAGLINYFGKSDSADDIQVAPILFKKGDIKLSIFGLGSIRDERLFDAFKQEKVKLFRPSEDPDDWFNIFCIHQNRTKHGPENFIPETFLHRFLNLVIWGHEHECLIEPQENETTGVYISQPGSSIATSLSEAEVKEKHIGLLKIVKKDEGSYGFQMEKLKLKTVRPFEMMTINLDTETVPTATGKWDETNLTAFLTNKINEKIDEMATKRLENGEKPMKPLIRVRINYSGEVHTLNPVRFGKEFIDRVANAKDLIKFNRVRKPGEGGARKQNANGEVDEGDEDLDFERTTLQAKDTIPKLISDILKHKDMQLGILNENTMSNAVEQFVDKQETGAIDSVVKSTLEKRQKSLYKDTRSTINTEPIYELEESIKNRSRVLRDEEAAVALADVKPTVEDDIFSASSKMKGAVQTIGDDDDDDDDADDTAAPVAASRVGSTRGRGRGGAKATTARTATTRKKAVKKTDDSDEEQQEESENEDIKPTTKRGSAASKAVKTLVGSDDEKPVAKKAPARGKKKDAEADTKTTRAAVPLKTVAAKRATKPPTSEVIDLDGDDGDQTPAPRGRKRKGDDSEGSDPKQLKNSRGDQDDSFLGGF